MKAISLWAPWSDLVAWQYKTMETRFWSTNHRGDLLICTAKRYDAQVREHIDMFRIPEAWQCYFEEDEGYPRLPEDYKPRLGMAVAIVEVVDCIALSEQLKQREQWRRAACLPSPYATDGEWSLEGRYGWVLENIRPIEPFPVTGKQGFFEVELPESVAAFATPRVVHCKQTAHDIYIGRPSVWGNPWGAKGKSCIIVPTVEEAFENFRLWLKGEAFQDFMQSKRANILRRLPELRGKTLGCWCKTPEQPNALCHGDILLAFAEGRADTVEKNVCRERKEQQLEMF